MYCNYHLINWFLIKLEALVIRDIVKVTKDFQSSGWVEFRCGTITETRGIVYSTQVQMYSNTCSTIRVKTRETGWETAIVRNIALLFCFLPSDSLTHKSLPPISAPTRSSLDGKREIHTFHIHVRWRMNKRMTKLYATHYSDGSHCATDAF